MMEQGCETLHIHPGLQELKKLLKIQDPLSTFQRDNEPLKKIFTGSGMEAILLTVV
ncbi:rCG24593 [Rattus norvegicus]|uniref:RCG24593 n=1 Tax=Rattus norvegicus TaxID=10116 RepID=A6JCM0_RAT|nr:rCG24593 [Rattus norvegicus]